MHDFSEEVASETLRPGELRALLDRLAIQEFGAPDEVRVRDVAEMAQMTPEAVGRILADLRGESFEAWRARFEATLDQHGKRIEYLEKSPPVIPHIDPETLYDIVKEGERRKNNRNSLTSFVVTVLVILVVFGFCALSSLFMDARSSGPGGPSGEWATPKMVHRMNGHYFGYDSNGIWCEADAGGKPGPIVHQVDSEAVHNSLNGGP